MNKVATLILIVFSINIYAQSNQEIIAKIGNITISKQDFLERYELTPILGKEIISNKDGLKLQLIHSLIAEKLFAMDALQRQVDTIKLVKKTLEDYKKMFVKDALYKKEIVQKAEYTANSYLKKYLNQASQLWFIYISASNENEINKIYGLLKKGFPFDSLYTRGSDTLKVRIGDLTENVESELFNVKENSFSKPLFFKENWYICKIIKRFDPVAAHMQVWEEDYKRLKKIAKQRAEAEYYKKFMKQFFSGKKIEARGNLLKQVAEEASKILSEKEKSKPAGGKVYLTNLDLLKIQALLPQKSLDEIYINLEGEQLALKDFLLYLRFNEAAAEKTDFKSVLDLLNAKTKHFIEQELLAEEGFKEGLDKLPEVKKSYEMWRDNYLYYLMENSFNDSTAVSDSEAYQYYAENQKNKGSKYEYKISDISTNNLEEIEQLLDAVKSGKSFEELAKNYNSTSAAEFKPENFYGEIGILAERMKAGEVYGPVKKNDKYILFKIVDKREVNPQSQSSFESKKTEIKKEISQRKYEDKIIEYTVSLADQYGFYINEEALNLTNVTSVNILTYQMLGFGGKITAVPLSLPTINWYKAWKEQPKLAQ